MNLPFLPSPGRNDYPDPEDVKAIEAAFKTLFETIGPITERLFNDQKDFFLLVQAGFAVPGTAPDRRKYIKFDTLQAHGGAFLNVMSQNVAQHKELRTLLRRALDNGQKLSRAPKLITSL
jgi:hypothetical protein